MGFGFSWVGPTRLLQWAAVMLHTWQLAAPTLARVVVSVVHSCNTAIVRPSYACHHRIVLLDCTSGSDSQCSQDELAQIGLLQHVAKALLDQVHVNDHLKNHRTVFRHIPVEPRTLPPHCTYL